MFQDSLYNILKHSDVNSLKVVGIITDHQIAFTTNLGKGDIKHYKLLSALEKEMYPFLTEMEINEKQNENAHIFFDFASAIINFPENARVSEEQISMIKNVIVELSRYNREVPSKKRIPISLKDYAKTGYIYDVKELDEEIIKDWKRHYRPSEELDSEEIIGKRYSNGILGRIFR